MLRRSRQFLNLVAITFLATHALAIDWSQGGYADRLSVVQGGTIAFHIATTNSPFALQLVNLAHPADVLATIGGLTSAPHDCSGKWETGCGWPVTAQFTIPSNWPSGFYAAKFPTDAGTRWVFFVVKAAAPGSTSPIVVVATTNTYAAYNQFGGKSVYDERSTNHQRAHVVSFARPFDDNAGLGRFPLWEQQFVDWMTAESRPFEVIADDDLADPSILGHYRVALIAGHSEYWTRTMRENLAAFSNAGGHVAIFGGNTMWWQARVDLGARTFTCYKDAALDPESGVHDALVTVNFHDAPVYEPENFLTGLSFRNGGYANLKPGGFGTLPPNQRTPWTVRDASSWIFAGTGVVDGQQIAQATGGLETDGAICNVDPSGIRVADGSDGTPRNFQVLATIPGDSGYGVLGMFTNPSGGAVVNFGTQDWSHGLANDAAVAQMTRNVLDRLATGAPFSYQPRMSPWLTESTFNEPSSDGKVLPGWRGDLEEWTLTAQCAHEGALGLNLTGAHWTEVARRFIPTNGAIRAAQVELFLDAGALQSTDDWPIPLVELVNRTGAADQVFGVIELQKFGAARSVRLTTLHAATPWIVLDAGWQKLTASWQSPGAVTLRAGTQPAVQATNPDAGQTVNEIRLEFVGTDNEAVGSLCIDEIRVKACDPPSITQQPQSVTIVKGSSTTLSVAASGSAYQWFAGANAIGGATASSITVSPASTTTYHVRVSNDCGSVDSNDAVVTVCELPVITQQPQSVTIAYGASTTLSVSASGDAYQWFAGANAINGATSPSITVSPTSTTTYRVRVSTACGFVDSNNATVTVRPQGSTLLYTITPCRLVDTRVGAPPPSGSTRVVQVTGHCGIPPGAKAIAINVTAVSPTANGFLTAFASGDPLPPIVSVNYRTAKTRASSSISKISASGALSIYNDGSAGVHFLVDVSGYFQ